MHPSRTPGELPGRRVLGSLLAGAATPLRRSFLLVCAACGFAATAAAQVDSVGVQVTPQHFVSYCPASLTLTMTITTPPKIPGNFRYRILGTNPLSHAINNWGTAPAGTTFSMGIPFTIAGDYNGTVIVQTFSLASATSTQPLFQSAPISFSVFCLRPGAPVQGPTVPPRVP